MLRMIGRTRLFAFSGVRSFFCPRNLCFSQAVEGMSFRNIQRVLCVAEKNDAARGIADILSNGRMRRREGFSKYNKIYECQYHLFGRNVTVVMTSVSGHLLTQDFKLPFRKWHSCNPLVLFDADIEKFCPENYMDIKTLRTTPGLSQAQPGLSVPARDAGDVLPTAVVVWLERKPRFSFPVLSLNLSFNRLQRTLEREVQPCQALVIWTDCDREGENIGFEIIHVCKAVKPNLQVFRARFSEITLYAIRGACENLTQPDQNVSDAVDVRQELDLRIGAAFTRFQTLRLQKIFPDVLAEQLISYGSCQFPTLGFVVERFKAIEAFVSETFYKIKVTHEHEEGTVDFSWKRNRLFNHTACLVLYHMCMEDPVATVVDVGSKPKSKWRPLPLDTVELEKLASRKLRINAKETMKIAEKLYTQGYISYPRTETNIFPKNLHLPNLVELQTQDPQWGAFAQRILDQGGPTPRQGNKSDQAHPPIHPTKYGANLQGNDQRLYEFIVRHFLACCSRDAKGQETTVEIDIAKERFVAHGLMILERNYLEVYPYERWSDKVLPVYEQGSRFQPTRVEMVDGETCPPQLLTEADLISLMEKHGIGTDATHAEHIETIKSRMYVGLTPDQRFLPGHLGMGLVEGYDSMGYEMSKPDLRAELEADLKLICEGKKDKSVVLREQIQKYKQVFVEAVQKAKKLDEALSQYFGEVSPASEQEDIYPALPDPVRKCPQCNSDMVLKTKKNGGYFLSCMGYPTCKSAVWFPDSVLEVSKDGSVCGECSRPHPVHRLKLKFKPGSLPPLMPLEFVGCIGGCDETLREVLDLRYLQGPPRTSQWAGQQTDPLQVNHSSNHTGGRQTSHNLPLAGPRVPPAKTAQNPPASLVNRGRNNNNEDNNAVVCNCGQEAVLLTVRKEGPNHGRQFYKCSAGTCRFFLWDNQPADDASGGVARGFAPLSGTLPSVDRRPARSWGKGSDPGGGGGGGGGGDVVCRCDQLAVTRTVQKEGPNKGRPFHTCSKPREQQCGFFQWADENLAPASSSFPSTPFAGEGSTRGLGSKAKRSDSDAALRPPTTKRARTCGLCHQPGHTRKTCPQNH